MSYYLFIILCTINLRIHLFVKMTGMLFFLNNSLKSCLPHVLSRTMLTCRPHLCFSCIFSFCQYTRTLNDIVMNILHQLKHLKKRELYGNWHVFKIQIYLCILGWYKLESFRTEFYSQISYKQCCELLVFHRVFFSSIQNKIK